MRQGRGPTPLDGGTCAGQLAPCRCSGGPAALTLIAPKKLLRLLREHSGAYLRKLWQLSLDRRRETSDVAARGKVREEWGEPKRWLGTMGLDGRGKLMPSWSTVAKMPLYEVQAQLKRWNRVTRSRVLRGGQRALEGFVVRRA